MEWTLTVREWLNSVSGSCVDDDEEAIAGNLYSAIANAIALSNGPHVEHGGAQCKCRLVPMPQGASEPNAETAIGVSIPYLYIVVRIEMTECDGCLSGNGSKQQLDLGESFAVGASKCRMNRNAMNGTASRAEPIDRSDDLGRVKTVASGGTHNLHDRRPTRAMSDEVLKLVERPNGEYGIAAHGNLVQIERWCEHDGTQTLVDQAVELKHGSDRHLGDSETQSLANEEVPPEPVAVPLHDGNEPREPSRNCVDSLPPRGGLDVQRETHPKGRYFCGPPAAVAPAASRDAAYLGRFGQLVRSGTSAAADCRVQAPFQSPKP